MKQISNITSFSTELSQEYNTISTIEIDDKPFASGGFGEAYFCHSINGKKLTVPQVLKIFIDVAGSAQKGYDTIIKLQQKLKLKSITVLQQQKRALLDVYPALLGCPQFSFQGDINGKTVLGYSANNLKTLGFKEFKDILDEDKELADYQNLAMPTKMIIAYHLASAFEVLKQCLYIHADFKVEALFIHTQKHQCAIIDYDSGAVIQNPNDKPTTFGTKQDWLAPEIFEQISIAESKKRNVNQPYIVKVDLLSDMWSVTVGIHYLLFTHHPLFFLNEISSRSTKGYFSQYTFPNIDKQFPFFETQYDNYYLHYKHYFQNKLPNDVRDKFIATINDGYSNPSKRTTFSQWEMILQSLLNSSCKILHFLPNKHDIVEGESTTFTWKIENECYTEINGIDVTGQKQFTFIPSITTEYKLIAKNALGKSVEERRTIKVNKLPIIHFFQALDTEIGEGEEATLSWKADYQTELYLNGIKLYHNLKEHKFIPTTTQTTWVLRAENQYGKDISKTVTINVHKPPILKRFWTDKKAITSDDIVEVQWQAERADEFELIWREFEVATASWIEQRKTLPSSVTNYSLNLKGSEKGKGCTISLIAKSKYGSSTLPDLSVRVVNMPEFQFIPDKIDAIPEITSSTLGQFPEIPVLVVNTNEQIFHNYTPYPEMYKASLQEKKRTQMYFFVFCICLAVVSVVIGFLGTLLYSN